MISLMAPLKRVRPTRDWLPTLETTIAQLADVNTADTSVGNLEHTPYTPTPIGHGRSFNDIGARAGQEAALISIIKLADNVITPDIEDRIKVAAKVIYAPWDNATDDYSTSLDDLIDTTLGYWIQMLEDNPQMTPEEFVGGLFDEVERKA